MIHGLLEFVRERRMRRQRLSRPRPCHHLQPAQASPFTAPVLYLEEVASAPPPALPHGAHLSPASARDNSGGSALLNALHRRQGHGPRRKPCAQLAVESKRCLRPSHLAIKASPFHAESLPTRQHHQPQSSIRRGTKTPDVRHSYGSAPLPQHYEVQMRGQAWLWVTHTQLFG